MNLVFKCFRCGYCGHPTDRDGYVLNEQQIKDIGADGPKWDAAEQTHGECCVHQQERERGMNDGHD